MSYSRPTADGSASTVIPILDCHQHVGNIRPAEWTSDEWRLRDQADRATYMLQSGIDKCVIMPMPSMTLTHSNEMYATANTMLGAYQEERPDLIAGVCCTVNPADSTTAMVELERCFTKLSAVGVSFHHRYLGLNIDDPRMAPILEVARAFDRPVFVHIIAESEMEAPWRLFSLARRNPDVKFLALDGFSSPHQAAYLVDAAGDYPNIWFDTGVATAVAHGFGLFIEKYGAERLVIGTDNYSGPRNFYTAFPINEIGAMGLSPEELEKIAHNNLTGLLRLGTD